MEQKSEAQLYAERETRSLTSMRQEFGRLTDIRKDGFISYIPFYPHKDPELIWKAHVPSQGLKYYYATERTTT